MIKSFSDYLQESSREITIVRGAFNPPIEDHEKLFEAASKLSGGGKYRIHATKLSGTPKAPLVYENKIKYMRKMFPRHARAIVLDSHTSVQSILSDLYSEGYTKVNIVTESKDSRSYEAMISNSNRKETRHGFYSFLPSDIQIVSVQMNESKIKNITESVETESFQDFCSLLPSTFKESKDLYNDVRVGMGLLPMKDFRTHLRLETVSDVRESYIMGNLFNIGDEVVIKESNKIGKVALLGSNYVLIEMSDGSKVRKWLESIERVGEYDEYEEINEAWFKDLLDKVSKVTNRGGYREASKILKMVVDKKKKDGTLKHPTGYYAMRIAKQFKGNINPQELLKMISEEEERPVGTTGVLKTADYKISPTTGRKVRAHTINLNRKVIKPSTKIESFSSFNTKQ
jgi:hypothetical protein